MTSFLRYLSLAGATLFEIAADGAITTAGAISAASGAFTGAVTAASASLTGALSVGGLATTTPQTIDMGAANKTLIMTGTPGTNQVLLVGNVLAVSCTGATRTLTFPAASLTTGKVFVILNAGSQSVDVSIDGSPVTVTAGKGLLICSNGAGYGRLAGA